jgi:hypothetical protein
MTTDERTNDMLARFSPDPGAKSGNFGRRRRISRTAAVIAACAVATGSTLLVAAPAQAANTTVQASVYSDQWEDGYRGWVQGGVVMLCYADGAWSNGTNRWFAVYAGGISGFVNADLVANQIKVKPC